MKYLLAMCLMSVAALAHSAPHSPARTIPLQLHGHTFKAELATDNAARAHGLMNRRSLAANHGMLFVFPTTTPQWFWMKDTLIPLDILYFDGQRHLVSMQLNVPPCRSNPCPTYPSGKPARYVLELPAGTAAQMGIQTGDQLGIGGRIGPVR